MATNNQRSDDDLNLTEQTLRLFVTAYLLELAGMIDAPLQKKLDRVSEGLGRKWEAAVEEIFGLSVPFVRNLYATLLDRYLPHEALAFILRGLGFANPEQHLGELLGYDPDEESKPDSRPHFATTHTGEEKS